MASGRQMPWMKSTRKRQVSSILMTVKAFATVRILFEGLSELPTGALVSGSKPWLTFFSSQSLNVKAAP